MKKREITLCDDSISSFVGDAAYNYPLSSISLIDHKTLQEKCMFSVSKLFSHAFDKIFLRKSKERQIIESIIIDLANRGKKGRNLSLLEIKQTKCIK